MIPRVSVILTVYKRTEYLAEALRSVLDQSFPDFEIIVADDSGMAAAREIVANCGDLDRVKYLPNPTTLGVAQSLIRAVGEARGKYIAILNDDDVWEKEMLGELVRPLEADSDRVLSTSDHWIMDENGHIDQGLSESWSKQFGRSHLSEGVVANATTFAVEKGGPAINIASVLRKDAIDWSLVVSEVAGAYDYWIGCLLAATRRPIYYVPKRLARWRMHGLMETARRSHDKGENMVYICSTMLKRKWFPELESFLNTKLAEALFVVGRDKLEFERVQEARSYFWRSFLLQNRPRVLILAVATFLPSSIRTRLRA